MNENNLDKDLAAAIEADLAPRPMPSAAPFTAGRAERLRIMKNAEGPTTNTAMDQLRVACEGLLKLEQEWIQFARNLVGDIKLEEHDAPQPSTEGPLMPRLRSDSELLARLAIRQHRLIKQIEELL